MIIAFTGTRSGMSDKQLIEVESILKNIKSDEKITVLHGGCVGADIDFHNICKKLGENFTIEVYEGYFKNDPNNKTHVGEFSDADIIHQPQTHFKRNRDMVDRCDFLIGTPYTVYETNGGTWYTINYAKKSLKKVIIINR